MSQHPYQPPTADTPSEASHPLVQASTLSAAVGSVILVLLGLAVTALGMLPSDAPGFFVFTGVHALACGVSGVICCLYKPGWPGKPIFCVASILVNAALVVRIGMLVLDGTIRGPLIGPVMLLVAGPAAINLVAAVLNLRRRGVTAT
ncbi:MAG: hypothetical protein AAFX06_32390 [Planctomycetota bacterium]